MELYIGHLTSNETVNDLRLFFKSFEKKANFRIVKLLRPGGPLYYGLAEFDSDKLAQKAIKKLHSCKLNGRRVCLREYQHRSGGNERRALNWRQLNWQSSERRGQERREKSRQTRSQGPEFTGYNNMAVKYL